MDLAQEMLPQLDRLLADYEAMRSRSRYPDQCTDLMDELLQFISASVAAIHRAAGPNSQYARLVDRAVDRRPDQVWVALPNVLGALRALREDIANGWLARVEELVHADTFADLLEEADYFLSGGYKDAAAVLVGGVLETHLRNLCTKSNVPLEYADSGGDVHTKTADRLNAELAGASVYSKLDRKNVIAWLGLRNSAAHGKYDEYRMEQVRVMLAGVRDFITRNPA